MWVLSFPSLLLAFVFVAGFGRGVSNSIIALGIVYVPMLVRLVRSLTLVEKNKTYVEAAMSIGYSDMRIMFCHILPNCISHSDRAGDFGPGLCNFGPGFIKLPWPGGSAADSRLGSHAG